MTGAFFGWIGAMMLHGLAFFLLFFVLVLPLVLGYQWLSGQF